jgi:hypothetical protein
MNKIYSKVWNRSLGRLVVASEHARANGKGGTSRRWRAMFGAVAMAVAGWSAGGAAMATEAPAVQAV